MPQINIEYNKEVLSLNDIKKVGAAIQKIVEDLTPGRLVFVNASSFDFSLNSDPLEILIHLSQEIINNNRTEYLDSIVDEFKKWKKTENFNLPTNIVLIPMNWDLRINV